MSTSKIDGGLLCDKNGICYAIGVILDGMLIHMLHFTINCYVILILLIGPISERGSLARGSRFNSSIHYVHFRQSKQENVVIVCISEDGYVNIENTNNLERKNIKDCVCK
jgi:hypothetical protein